MVGAVAYRERCKFHACELEREKSMLGVSAVPSWADKTEQPDVFGFIGSLSDTLPSWVVFDDHPSGVWLSKSRPRTARRTFPGSG